MRLLIVEGDRTLAKFLESTLTDSVCTTRTVYSSADATAVLSFKEYAAVLVDLDHTDERGVDVIRHVRGRAPVVPILILAGRADPHAVVVALEAGADDFVTKPLCADELAARIRALVGLDGPRFRDEFRLGPLRLVRAASGAWLGDADLGLTRKEFALLWHLAHNVGRMVAGAELLEHVWGDDQGPISNVVNVTVGRLRKKLKVGAAHPRIVTRRFAGFTLTME